MEILCDAVGHPEADMRVPGFCERQPLKRSTAALAVSGTCGVA